MYGLRRRAVGLNDATGRSIRDMMIGDVLLREVVHESRRSLIRRATRGDGAAVLVKLPRTEHASAEDVASLEHELAVLETLAGPGVCEVLGLHEVDGVPALVMPDDGHVRLPRTRLPLRRFLAVAVEVTRALVRVHAGGLVHCDLNPANVVWREADGDVRLIDFGLATTPLDAEAAAARGLTGTLEFIAPEQTGRTSRGIDHRADLYSLGATFHLWLSGEPPFHEDDALGYVHAHLSKPVPRLGAPVPEVLARMVERLLAKAPEARYQRTEALLADLVTCQRYLDTDGEVPLFELATTDQRRRLPPAPLVERDAALALATGARTLVIIEGAPGTGKSALLDEARRRWAGRAAVHAVRGSVANANVPLAGLASALTAIADHTLVLPSPELEARRRAWSAALAPNGAVLVELAPHMGAVLGPQPPVAELGPRESETRRRQAVEALFRAVAASAPLVFLVDDAGKLDAQSQELLLRVATQRPPGLMMVLTVGPDDAAQMGAALVGAGLGPDHLAHTCLAPLSTAGLAHVLASRLGRPADELGGLVAVVHAKTGGSPRYVDELLEQAQDDNLVRHDAERGWVWDEAGLWALPEQASAIELVRERARALSPAARTVLEAAACLGEQFDGAVLRAVAADPTAVDGALIEGEAQRLVRPADGGERTFVSWAAWSVVHDELDPGRRAALHLAIGRHLAAGPHDALATGTLFAAVRHFRAAATVVTSADERRTIIGLEREAADRARDAGGYQIAAEHLAQAMALSAADPERDPAAHFALGRAHAECVGLSGDWTTSIALASELLATAPGPRERAIVHGTIALAQSNLNRFHDVIATIRVGLRELGVDLPSEPAAIGAAIGAGMERMQAQLAATPPRELARLPAMTDPDRVQIMDLLFQLIPAAFQSDPPVFVVAELMMLDLAVEHGVVASSAKNFIDCGIIQVKVFGDHARALELADAAHALLDRFRPTPLESAVGFVHGAFIAQWRDDLDTILAVLDRARASGDALGDVQHASYAAVWRGLIRRYWGAPLRACLADLDDGAAHARNAGGVLQNVVAASEVAMLRALCGTPAAEDEGWLERAGVEGPVPRLMGWQAELVRRYVMRDLAGARAAAAEVAPLMEITDGMISQCERVLFLGLVDAAPPADATAEQVSAARARLAAAVDRTRVWADLNPGLFAAVHRLLAAELARFDDAPAAEIASHYDAIVDDPASKALHLKALACERQAELWLEQGRRRLARPLLREAYRFYERWGAEAKLQQLAARYRDELGAGARESVTATTVGASVVSTRSHGPADQRLDVESVVKAVTSIASEVKPERLFAALLRTILENAGAERGCLISAHDELWLEACAAVDGPVNLGRTRLEDAPTVASDVVRYVARTGTAVILAAAGKDERFARDPHVVRDGVQSVLCIPIASAGVLRGVLYVENNAVAGAFTPRHVRMLEIIAGQAASSIDNARIYERLEDIVGARTAELDRRNRDMQALLDQLPQGVLTLGPELRIEAGFSARLAALLGTDALAGREVGGVLFAGSDVGPEARATHDLALASSFGAPRVLAELNWPHLIRELRRSTGDVVRVLELDWSPIVDDQDDVVRVLATVRDVTELRALERRLAEASEEATVVTEVLTAGLDAFAGFIDDARDRLDRARALLGGPAGAEPATIDDVYRQLHTLKGNARMLGLAACSRAIHGEEEPYGALRGRGADPDEREALLAGLDRLRRGVDERTALIERRLGRTASGDGRAEAALAALADELASADAADPGRTLDRIAAALRAATAVPLAEVARRAGRAFSSLADELGKPTPTLVVGGDDLPVDRATARAVTDALVHVYRNAIDHGIEAPAARAEAGKPPGGRVAVTIRVDGEAVEVAVGDDGRGLPLAALRARASAELDDDAIAELVFRSGVSTAERVTQISGRGVGMAAVRDALATVGGAVGVRFVAAERDGLRPFELVLRLPRPTLPAAARGPRAARGTGEQQPLRVDADEGAAVATPPTRARPTAPPP